MSTHRTFHRAARATSARAALAVAMVLLAAPAPAGARQRQAQAVVDRKRIEAADTTAVGELRRQARQLRPLMKTTLAHRFLDATADLPHVTPRVVFRDSSGAHYYGEGQAATLPDSVRSRLVRRTLDEEFYYFTR